MSVALHRSVKRGTKGTDAFAVKRMLKRKGFGRGIAMGGAWRFKFGPVAVLQLKRFQRRYKVQADGVYGLATHRKAVSAGGFDKYGRLLMRRAPRPKAVTTKRRALALALLEARKGVVESPYGSNKQPYGRWYGWNGVAWCAIFVTWAFGHAGAPRSWRTPLAWGWESILPRTRNPEPGDVVVYTFQHVGIFRRWIHRQYGIFEAVEGNTSRYGSQNNGGAVLIQRRSMGIVRSFRRAGA